MKLTATMRRPLRVVAAGGRIVKRVGDRVVTLHHPDGLRETLFKRTFDALLAGGWIAWDRASLDLREYVLTPPGERAAEGACPR